MSETFSPCIFCSRTDMAPDEDCPWGCAVRHGPPPTVTGETTEEWAERITKTKTCHCVQHAREHLSNAQNLMENYGDTMGGHAFFTLGCALNSLINHVDGNHDPD
jgi:hypothetical protein